MNALFEGLQEAKDLYAQRYGESVDLPEPEESFEEQDGAPGVTVVGVGVDAQRVAYTMRMDALFESLQEAKGLYAQRYGESVDLPEPEESFEEQDGVPGVTVVGVGADAQRATYTMRMDALFESLQEAKDLYAQRYGESVDLPEEFFEEQ